MGQMFSYDAIKLPPAIPSYENQSRTVKGAVATRVSHFALTDDALPKRSDPEVTTVYENFLRGLKLAGENGECLGYRPSADSPYKWLSYEHVRESSRTFGCALRHVGLKPGEGTFVGIYAQNRPEWVLTYLGAISQSMAIVPLYDTLGPEAVEYILTQAEIELVVCDTVTKARQLLANAHKLPCLKHIVVMDKIDDLSSSKVKVQSFEEMLRSVRVEKYSCEMVLPKADDLYMLCYTSGTTGDPKGVMLTHGNLVAFGTSISTLLQEFGFGNLIRPGRSSISYLPLAHAFEQVVHIMAFFHGAKIGFFRGNIATLLDDCKVLQPSFFPVVPRLLNKLYDKVQANLVKASTLSRWVYAQAYAHKLALLDAGIVTKHSVWDRLVFRKVQEELGGCVEFMATGAAPISGDVLTFCRVALGCVLLEGYGQTESAAACTVTLPGDSVPGSIGAPLSCAKVKLDDIPEMKYFAKDGKGEICILGPAVMRGYYKQPDKTKETIDEHGWLHTGDVGEWLPNGTLKIIDRKKHIFKLAQGEYIAPEKIENVFALMPLISQIFVDGNSLHPYLVAIVVPDESATRDWFRNNVVDDPSSADRPLSDLCVDAQFTSALRSLMDAHGKTHKLNGIERPKHIRLSVDAFTVDNGLLTPTFKAKRPQLREHFAKQIEQLYQMTSC